MEFNEQEGLNAFPDNQEGSSTLNSNEEVDTTISEALEDLNTISDIPADSDSLIDKNLDYISKLCDESNIIASETAVNNAPISPKDDKICAETSESLELNQAEENTDNIDLNELTNSITPVISDNNDLPNEDDEATEVGDAIKDDQNKDNQDNDVLPPFTSTSEISEGFSSETSESQKIDEGRLSNQSETESGFVSENNIETPKEDLNFSNSPNTESQDSNGDKEAMINDDLREDSQEFEEDPIELNEDQNHNENREFVQVSEKDDDKDEANKDDENLEDPIGGDGLEAMVEGQDEELCIIPDHERITAHDEDIPCPLKQIETPEINDKSGDITTLIVRKNKNETPQNCYKCDQHIVCKYEFMENESKKYLCEDICLESLKSVENVNVVLKWENEIRVKALSDIEKQKSERVCKACDKAINNDNYLSWEIMEFCNDTCLSKVQNEIGSKCCSCVGPVRQNALGKYCVRFGNDIRQFCSSHCLEDFKKGLKVCSYCQQDVSSKPDSFAAPVGDKGNHKDFCSKECLNSYDVMTNGKPPVVPENTKCGVCKLDKPITIVFDYEDANNYFCGDPCFTAYSFVNNIKSGKCAMCNRKFAQSILEQQKMFYEGETHHFCTNSCKNIYVIANRKIVPCSWCRVKKYNFDMIQKFSATDQTLNMCSLNCLSLYQVSFNAIQSKRTACDHCQKNCQAMYHLTMSDATVRNFCSYICVWEFQNQYWNQTSPTDEPVPTGGPKKTKKKSDGITLPVISNVHSLATTNGSISAPNMRTTRSKANSAPTVPTPVASDIPAQMVKHHIVVKQPAVPEVRNVSTMCRPRVSNKGTSTASGTEEASTQTVKREADKILIPVPVPIFVPLPLHMYTMPTPMPVPIPIPVPVPIFIPTTRNSATGIMKEIKKIQVKIPTNPYEAELLMMAEMVADDKKEEHTDSESDEASDVGAAGGFSPDPQDATTSFGDDMLQMALKMATELDEPAVDLEGALTANTITAAQQEHVDEGTEVPENDQDMSMMDRAGRGGRKRSIKTGNRGQAKRGRRSMSQIEMPVMAPQPPPEPVPLEKPDANMCLKYTFGVNAWKQWVTYKNAELEKSSRRVKLFKTEILQLTSDELNYSLCLFVKEVRKPNGAEYAPDTIYYLCLGIQQYLFENGRIDNIFCDPYYEMFTDCLDEVAKKFSVLYNDSHYIVTRVEEEHLWESKQLGAHSPHVLLSTLMFFNTKHFNLTTVEEHMQLSFSHIMKHWKRNPTQVGSSKAPGSRNVLLRFYPPQSAQLLENSAKKKKVYEQQENEENPLRCPVKLYEFYLSKCPESVKTRNDVFYLQPERSCVPDSPVWYSTMALPKEALEKMLHRVKMVKEINVALLTS